jgi:SAM-dependent methyltransferase
VDHAQPYVRLAQVYDELVVDPVYDKWAAYLHDLWSAAQTPVRRVLDVCCGTGLLAEQLVARGYEVVGVDSSAEMLDRARQRLGDEATLLRQTLPDLAVDGPFDAAVSTFDGLNYLTPTELRLTLAAVARTLRAGGWVVFDLHTDAMMDFTVAHPVVSGEAEGRIYSITSSVDVRERTCDTRIEMSGAAGGDRFTETHRQYFFTGPEVRSALAEAGFEQVTVTEEYSAEPVNAGTLRATWTARLRSAR